MKLQEIPLHEPCALCGGIAVGVCASCHRSVCVDCAVMILGAAQPYAVCLKCKDAKKTLRTGWLGLLGMLLAVIAGALLLILVISQLIS